MPSSIILLILLYCTFWPTVSLRCLEGADCLRDASCDECEGVACTRVISFNLEDNKEVALTCIPYDTRKIPQSYSSRDFHLEAEGCHNTAGDRHVCVCYEDYCNSDMLLQYDPNDSRGWSTWFNIAEIFFIIGNIPLALFSAMGIWRVHLHFNLKVAILPCFFYLGLIHFPSRLFMHLYYFRILSPPEYYDASIGIAVPSAISTFSLTYVVFAMFGAFLERCLATHYVSTYEFLERRYIGYLTLLGFPLAVLITVPVFMEYLPWYVLGFVDGPLGVLTSIGFLFLSWRNRRNYRILMSSPVSRGYSLSQRWQMDENVSTTAIVKNIIVFVGFCPACNMYAFSMMYLDEPNLGFYMSLFHLSLAFESFWMFMVGTLSRAAIRAAIVAPLRQSCGSTITTSSSFTESERYFQHLQQQWAVKP